MAVYYLRHRCLECGTILTNFKDIIKHAGIHFNDECAQLCSQDEREASANPAKEKRGRPKKRVFLPNSAPVKFVNEPLIIPTKPSPPPLYSEVQKVPVAVVTKQQQVMNKSMPNLQPINCSKPSEIILKPLDLSKCVRLPGLCLNSRFKPVSGSVKVSLATTNSTKLSNVQPGPNVVQNKPIIPSVSYVNGPRSYKIIKLAKNLKITLVKLPNK